MKNTLKKVIATTTALTLIIGGTVFATGQGKESEAQKVKSYKTISLEKAKEIALKDAKLDLTHVTFKEAELGEDDNVKQYELEFVSENTEYDYEIRLADGKIVDKDIERINKSEKDDDRDDKFEDDLDDDHDDKFEDDLDDDYDDVETSDKETKGLIGISKAKEIALKHIGLTADQVKFESVELDTDDGQKVYEVEFEKENKEYEFKINAETGQVIDFESEIED